LYLAHTNAIDSELHGAYRTKNPFLYGRLVGGGRLTTRIAAGMRVHAYGSIV